MLGTATKLKNTRNISLTGAVSGNTNFDGSGNVIIKTTQANIAVITGSLVTPAAGTEVINGQVDVSYPNGFNSSNSVIISLMGQRSINPGEWATHEDVGSRGILNGSSNLNAVMMSNAIRVSFEKTTTQQPSQTINFRIVLMKIS